MPFAYAGSTATSTSGADASALGVGIGGGASAVGSVTNTSNPQAVVNQTFEGTKVPAGVNRQDPGFIMQGNATMPAFFGPFVPGWKVLDDLTSISKLTKKEADTLGGGTKCLLKVKNKVWRSKSAETKENPEGITSWEMDQVNILYQFDRKLMPEPVGWIFCTADGETTIDIVADAAKLAMSVGGTDLVLLKHKVEYSTAGGGAFLNGGFTRGQLSGSEKENTVNIGGVSGIGYGKTWGVSDDGIVFGIIRR